MGRRESPSTRLHSFGSVLMRFSTARAGEGKDWGRGGFVVSPSFLWRKLAKFGIVGVWGLGLEGEERVEGLGGWGGKGFRRTSTFACCGVDFVFGCM